MRWKKNGDDDEREINERQRLANGGGGDAEGAREGVGKRKEGW